MDGVFAADVFCAGSELIYPDANTPLIMGSAGTCTDNFNRIIERYVHAFSSLLGTSIIDTIG